MNSLIRVEVIISQNPSPWNLSLVFPLYPHSSTFSSYFSLIQKHCKNGKISTKVNVKNWLNELMMKTICFSYLLPNVSFTTCSRVLFWGSEPVALKCIFGKLSFWLQWDQHFPLLYVLRWLCCFGRTLRYIYGCLQKSVQHKWPTNTTMRTRVVR